MPIQLPLPFRVAQGRIVQQLYAFKTGTVGDKIGIQGGDERLSKAVEGDIARFEFARVRGFTGCGQVAFESAGKSIGPSAHGFPVVEDALCQGAEVVAFGHLPSFINAEVKIPPADLYFALVAAVVGEIFPKPRRAQQVAGAKIPVGAYLHLSP